MQHYIFKNYKVMSKPTQADLHLMGLLDTLQSHPFLKGKLILKSGSALNLFVFDVTRLSVDIDLNYVGAEATS